MVLFGSYLPKSIQSYIRVLVIVVLLIYIWFHFSCNKPNECKIDYHKTLPFESTKRQNEHSYVESSSVKDPETLQICLLVSPKLSNSLHAEVTRIHY
jgi:hypothetical protein